MSGARGGDLTPDGVQKDVEERHELPRLELFARDLVGAPEKPGRAAAAPGEHPERVLRHRHVRGGRDALSEDVPDDDRQAPVLEHDEVVEIAAYVNVRRGLVHVPDLQPRHARELARKQRALHRLREVLLLLVEARVVDSERGLRGDGHGRLELRGRQRAPGVEGDDGEGRQHLPRCSEREHGGRRALAKERVEDPVSVLRRRVAGLEKNCPLRAHEPPGERCRERLRKGHQAGDYLFRPGVGDADSPCRQRFGTRIRHADDCEVGIQELDHRAGDRVQSRVERDALGERLGNRVEASELPGGVALRLERALEDLRELLRPLVEARVLHSDRELAREREQEPFFALLVRPRTPLEDPQSADRLVVDEQRDEERPADTAGRDDVLRARRVAGRS